MSTIHEPLVLGLEHAGMLMTPEEFDAVTDCDELYVYELIHGVLVVSPPPAAGERGPNEHLGFLLRLYRETHPQGKALSYTLPEHTVRTRHSRRRADRVIWCGLNRRANVHRDPPVIVVEFVSEGLRNRRRDFEEKRDEYREICVAEYWIIDRFRRQMTVFRCDAAPGGELVVREEEIYTTPLLPGFELPLAKILAEADWLAADEAEDD